MTFNNTVPRSSSPSLILLSFPSTKMSVFTRTLPRGKAPSVSPAEGVLRAASWAEAGCKQAFRSFKRCPYFSKENVID